MEKIKLLGQKIRFDSRSPSDLLYTRVGRIIGFCPDSKRLNSVIEQLGFTSKLEKGNYQRADFDRLIIETTHWTQKEVRVLTTYPLHALKGEMLLG